MRGNEYRGRFGSPLAGVCVDVDGGWFVVLVVFGFRFGAPFTAAIDRRDQSFREAALIAVFRAYFGGCGEETECRVGDDLFNLNDFATRFCGGRQVDRGDLETVEEEAGAFGVDPVGGDAAEDVSDGALDAAAIVGVGQVEVEWGLRLVSSVGVLCGAACGVVVVTKFFAAEAWAAAAVSVGEDVAALEALGGV